MISVSIEEEDDRKARDNEAWEHLLEIHALASVGYAACDSNNTIEPSAMLGHLERQFARIRKLSSQALELY